MGESERECVSECVSECVRMRDIYEKRDEEEEANKGKRKKCSQDKTSNMKGGQCYRSASVVSEVLRGGKGRPCTQKRFLYGCMRRQTQDVKDCFLFTALDGCLESRPMWCAGKQAHSEKKTKGTRLQKRRQGREKRETREKERKKGRDYNH